jgi:hypothetical protein
VVGIGKKVGGWGECMSLRSSEATPSTLWPVGCDPVGCDLPGQGVGLPADYLQGANRRVSPV